MRRQIELAMVTSVMLKMVKSKSLLSRKLFKVFRFALPRVLSEFFLEGVPGLLFGIRLLKNDSTRFLGSFDFHLVVHFLHKHYFFWSLLEVLAGRVLFSLARPLSFIVAPPLPLPTHRFIYVFAIIQLLADQQPHPFLCHRKIEPQTITAPVSQLITFSFELNFNYQQMVVQDLTNNYQLSKFSLDHHRDKNPTPQPITEANTPKISISQPAFHLFRPIRVALAHPKLNSYKLPKAMIIETCPPNNAKKDLKNSRGTDPQMRKEIKVAAPHLGARSGSTGASLCLQSMSILAIACLCGERSQVTVLASCWEQRAVFVSGSILVQIQIRSSFICSKFYSILVVSFALIFLIQLISALQDKQSPRPILIAFANNAANAILKRLLLGVYEAMPESKMIMVAVEPSSPPQTIDFNNPPLSK